MDALAKTVGEILHSGDQYLIPFFQRHYSWSRRHWDRLWLDVIALLEDGDKPHQHFLGPLVCTPVNQIPGEVKSYQLIDGQQRVTTIALMLSALRDHANEHALDQLSEEVSEKTLIHRWEKGLQRYKVIPRVGDREALMAVIDGKVDKRLRKEPVVQAWRYFHKRIGDWLVTQTPDDLRRLFAAITGRLSLVVIVIKEENPFEIFESLNSTGLPLEESDLIRNYLFMQVPIADQATFNDHHWNDFERIYDADGDRSAKAQTVFYRTYLMRNGVYSKAKFTFVDFKDQNRQRELSPNEQVEELIRFAKLERNCRRPDTCDDEELRDALTDIDTLEIRTAFPLVINLLARLDAGEVSRETMLGCLEDLASFVLRRSICGESTRSYGRWFCEAIAAIKDDPRGDLRKYWIRRGWPDDTTFVARLQEFPIYRREFKKCGLILQRLERSYKHKEKVVPSSLTIEHVMPRTITGKAWKAMLGEDWQEVHDRRLHSLGNLTLTGYNSELGNKPFAAKQEQLLSSNLVLNRYFKDLEVWNEDAIVSRGEQLAKEVTTFWRRPTGGEYVPPPETPKTKLSTSEQRQRKLEYWTEFLSTVKDRSEMKRLPMATRRGWVAFPFGRRGFRVLAFLNLNKRLVGVALACRGKSGKDNFRKLRDQRAQIEHAIGEHLIWQELPSQASSHVTLRMSDADPLDQTDWARQHQWLADRVVKFSAVFSVLCQELCTDATDAEDRDLRLERFWQTLLERAKVKTTLHGNITPKKWNYISTGAGHYGLQYIYVVLKNRASVEFYIDRGKGRKAENKQIFDQLESHRAQIDATFEGELTWERLDGKRASRICFRLSDGGFRSSEEEWPVIQAQMIDAMIRLEKAISPHVKFLGGDS